MCQLGKKLGVYRDVLKHGPIGPRASAAIGASSRSRLSPNKIVIRIVSTVKCYFRLYSPKNWEFRTRCQLDTCDDRRSCTGVGLPPYTIITPSVKRLQSVEPVYTIISHAHLFVSGYCLYEYLTT
ncbi:hypothetical protein TNCV_4040441 [Trichonephila clavipes]|nr:hypothetical protein TNCV_4040441 [Trichonephila clavipes]